MAEVILKDVVKIYPYSEKKEKRKAKDVAAKKTNLQITEKGVVAVQNFNLTIKDGEFVVLVGPSGCGKSTTLRMVAGLEDISEGELYINGMLCNSIEPKERDIAMVFQSYALYPHMTVYKNMEYPLTILKQKIPYRFEIEFLTERNAAIATKIEELKAAGKAAKATKLEESIKANNARIEECKAKIATGEIDYVAKMSRAMRKYKVQKVAEMLNITEYLDRKPKALSGGQRQRVAIGRAIVRNPNVLLMDEPLSNLDAKLRNEMRAEIIKLRKKISTTFIYVTHDQIEAMTLGDRIVVMKDGFIQQIGTPQDVYDHPRNKFVSGFIGTPKMNYFDGHLSVKDGKYSVTTANGFTVALPEEKNERLRANQIGEQDVTIGVRPGHIKLNGKGIEGQVTVSELMGDSTHLHISVGDHDIIAIAHNEGVCQDYSGKVLKISFEGQCVHVFSKEGQEKNLEYFNENYHKRHEEAEAKEQKTTK